MTAAPPWWQSTTIYQVYPRSFADSNADGLGDLRGVIDRLDHLAELGVETVWLSPFFTSPQEDFGYDVADYCGVAPEFGTLEDAEALIGEVHRRGMKVMLDMVMNHSSAQHPWFLLSKASRSNPKSDWYIWRDGRGPKGRRPPNNWRCPLEMRSAWQWGAERQQWYLASFLPCQPDLNWRNPEVREAMFDAVRFWLDAGVDGFRLDMFGAIMKDPSFRSNPVAPRLSRSELQIFEHRYTENTEDNVQLAKDLRAVCDAYSPERILLGEVFGPTAQLRRYLGDETDPGLQLVFLFDFLAFEYRAAFFRRLIEKYEKAFPAPLLPTYVLENHDRSRCLDRVGGDLRKARSLAVLLCTLRGVPTIYQGQEIGMANRYVPISEARDPFARTFFSWMPEMISKRLPERVNRDEVRTPMQWDDGPNAGFSPAGGVPWLPVADDFRTRNVQVQTGDPASMLELYRSLLQLRRARPALHAGELQLLEGGDDVVAFRRLAGTDAVVVAVNLGDGPARVPLGAAAHLLVASDTAAEIRDDTLRLPPHSGAVADLAPA